MSRHRLLADADLLASAALVPSGFVRVESALLSALDGPAGLASACAAQLRAGQLLVAVARYRAADALEAEAVHARRWLLLGAAPALVPLAVGSGAGWVAITHVVTAGAPVGGMAAPRGVQVLSLENRQDVVPHTDAAENADDDEHVTVLFDHDGVSVGDNHGLATAYLPAARDLDLSADVSVRAWLEGADRFLAVAGEQVSAITTVYTVSNDTDGDGQVDHPR